MNIYEYNRISTSSQEIAQQHNSVQEFIQRKGWAITESVSDEGVSGSVSYKERNLYKLIQRMAEGDVLIVSEISRLGRSMADLNKLVNDELKPRKLRLIIVKMGLDLNCSRLKAIDEMVLFAFSFSAQIEREMIQERTQSAIDVRKKKIADNGSFVSKSGRVCTSLGRPKGCEASEASIQASAESRRAKAKSNSSNSAFAKILSLYESRNGRITRETKLDDFCAELNHLGYKTSTGLDFNPQRCRSMIYRVRDYQH